MKLESLSLWEEKSLLAEQGNPEDGFLCAIRCALDGAEPDEAQGAAYGGDAEFRYELRSLLRFLESEEAGYLFRDRDSMAAMCRGRLRDHVPYAFRRECWGFRVMTENRVWYMVCTPWHEHRPGILICYDRALLMGALAKERHLPENCWGVYPFTGERIRVRFGAADYESYPQYGASMAENRAYADAQNAAQGLTPAQVSAMENGVIYGWETPMANPGHYDAAGYYRPTDAACRQEETWAL